MGVDLVMAIAEQPPKSVLQIRSVKFNWLLRIMATIDHHWFREEVSKLIRDFDSDTRKHITRSTAVYSSRWWRLMHTSAKGEPEISGFTYYDILCNQVRALTPSLVGSLFMDSGDVSRKDHLPTISQRYLEIPRWTPQRKQYEAELQARIYEDIIRNKREEILPPITRKNYKSKIPVNPAETLAKTIACGIYDDEQFTSMPILADALEDAGCVNTAVLEHCRYHPFHTRGCWVLRQLLFKLR